MLCMSPQERSDALNGACRGPKARVSMKILHLDLRPKARGISETIACSILPFIGAILVRLSCGSSQNKACGTEAAPIQGTSSELVVSTSYDAKNSYPQTKLAVPTQWGGSGFRHSDLLLLGASQVHLLKYLHSVGYSTAFQTWRLPE